MTAPAPEVDYAHTKAAETNRVSKAHALARWAFERNVDGPTIAAAPSATRRSWARAAGVTAPSTNETWDAVITALAQLEEWAAEHPDHEKAQRIHAAPEVDTPPDAPEVVIEDAPVVPLHPETADPVADWPRGWDVVAALAPLARKDALCARCGAPAVTSVPMSGSREEWRCGGHPPRPTEWGYRLNWTPRADDSAYHPDRPHRCYHSRCPQYVLNASGTPMAASALLDERAAANGKNRAPVHVRQAAREAQERRKAAEKELRHR